MSRAYRITVKESVTREVKAEDEICTRLELLDILPPEATAEILRAELEARGFKEREDGKLARVDGGVTVAVDTCNGEVSVKAEAKERLSAQGTKETSGWDDVGPSGTTLRAKASEQLKAELEKKLDKQAEHLQAEATAELEKHLNDLQPEISQVVNKVTREALKQKAKQMGTVTDVHEDETSGSMTIKIEV